MSQMIASSGFANKVVLITGASTGIGLATAELLEAQGSKVLLLARSFPDPQKASQQMVRMPVDIRNRQELMRIATLIKQQYGQLDGLFVNAGVAEFVALDELDDAHVDRVIDTNVKGALLSAQCFARWSARWVASSLRVAWLPPSVRRGVRRTAQAKVRSKPWPGRWLPSCSKGRSVSTVSPPAQPKHQSWRNRRCPRQAPRRSPHS